VRINCLSCGHKIDLDGAYDDFEGPVKCLCGALLEIKTEEGKLKKIRLAAPQARAAAKPRSLEGLALT
jgi:hypothetical protein